MSLGRRLPAGANPCGFGFGEDDALRTAVHDAVRFAPTGVTHPHTSLAGRVIVDKNGLFAVLIGEVAEVLASSVTVDGGRSEEHTSELQSHSDLVCRLLLEKK